MNDKQASLLYWSGRRFYAPSLLLETKLRLSESLASVPEGGIALDGGGGDFSEKSSSRYIYDYLTSNLEKFTLCVVDLPDKPAQVPENAVYLQGDLDELGSLVKGPCHHASFVAVIQEPIDWIKLIQTAGTIQYPGDRIFFSSIPLTLNEGIDIVHLAESKAKGYRTRRFFSHQVPKTLEKAGYKIETLTLTYGENHSESARIPWGIVEELLPKSELEELFRLARVHRNELDKHNRGFVETLSKAAESGDPGELVLFPAIYQIITGTKQVH